MNYVALLRFALRKLSKNAMLERSLIVGALGKKPFLSSGGLIMNNPCGVSGGVSSGFADGLTVWGEAAEQGSKGHSSLGEKNVVCSKCLSQVVIPPRVFEGRNAEVR